MHKAKRLQDALIQYKRFISESEKWAAGSDKKQRLEYRLRASDYVVEIENILALQAAAQQTTAQQAKASSEQLQAANNRIDQTTAKIDVFNEEIEELKKRLAALEKQNQPKPPVYKRAWFWVLIGGLVVGGAVATGFSIYKWKSDNPSEPSSDLGVQDVVIRF